MIQGPGSQGREMDVRSVGICVKPGERELAGVVRELEKWLSDRGLEVLPDPEAGRWTLADGLLRSDLAARADIVVVLGGDGTLLAVARAIGTCDVPILGVNLGTLGFLAETGRGELFPSLEAVLAGRFVVEPRMRFDVSVQRNGDDLGHYLALNDAVISNMALSRMVHLETRADGAEVTVYHADGLIVATPTGSTAYSLSAGGPLLLPSLEAIVLTPISPHTLTHRPLVLPETSVVEVRVKDARGHVRLTVDGQVGRELEPEDLVTVRRAGHPALLLVPPGRNRFELMRAKLRWGER
jgi:NAD+ kinase